MASNATKEKFLECKRIQSQRRHRAQPICRDSGRRLAYRTIGSGKPIVLCTRFRGNMDLWDPAFLDALTANSFRVITFDYSGLGFSSGEKTYDPVSLTRDALNQQLPTVQLLTFPQAGHGPHHEHQEACAEHIATFVCTLS